MADITTYTIKEMIEDYYASQIEAKACDKLGLEDRAIANRTIMAVIDAEFARREIVPPWRES